MFQKEHSSRWLGSSVEDFFIGIEAQLKRIGFIDPLDELGCFNLIRTMHRNDSQMELWNKLDVAPDMARFELSVGVTEDELIKATGGLQRYKEAIKLQKRMMPVCGKDFECSEENFSGLWAHISGAVSEPALPSVDLDKVSASHEPPRKKPGPGGGGRPPGKARQRQPQAVKDLIGLAGEIQAYRSLLREYGPTVISPSVWKSSNSRFKFPDNTGDDGLGCDFVFHQAGKEYHIEVKATQGEDESFRTWSNKIRDAVEVANKRSITF